jgi:hypothetical protein
MINSGEGWAVADGGQFFHYTTSVNSWGLFYTLPVAPPIKLNSVFISNPGNNPNVGFAVGNGGTIVELSESGGTATWNIINPLGFGTTNKQNLYGVYFTDSNHGWIVGAQGTILATTDGGNTWSGGAGQVNMGPTLAPPALRSVSVDMFGTGSGNGDGWAVGDSCTSPCDPENGMYENSVMAHWDGQIWTNTVISPPIAAGLSVNSVTVHGTQDGWAVGAGPYTTPPPVPLASIIHLDPLQPPVSGGGTGGATTVVTTLTPVIGGSATTVATTVTVTPATVAATTATGTSVSTVMNILTTGTTVTGTSSIVSTASMVITSIAVSTALIYNTLEVPGIPGFPWESIMAGILIGLACIGILRRIKKR